MTQYNLTVHSAEEFNFSYWKLSDTEFVDPNYWMFAYDNEEEGFALAPIAANDYDQDLPFDFGGDSEQPWEAMASVPKESMREFIDFLKSVGFNQVSPWW